MMEEPTSGVWGWGAKVKKRNRPGPWHLEMGKEDKDEREKGGRKHGGRSGKSVWLGEPPGGQAFT